MDDGELIFTNATPVECVPETTGGTRILAGIHVYQTGGSSPSLDVEVETAGMSPSRCS